MLIAIQNHSTRVTDSDVELATRAIAHQVRYHAAPVWERVTPAIVFYPVTSTPPPGAQHVVILDNADQAGALGYHDVDPHGTPYSKVFAATTLDNGGTVLTGDLTVASVISHEVLEMLVDPSCHLWADDGNGGLVAVEVGDPVESDSYPVVVRQKDGTKVTVSVSNFVTDAWFTPTPLVGERFDWMGTVSAPFTMSKGGYTIVSKQGQVTQTFGDEYPDWRKAAKTFPAARTARRVAQSPI